MFRTSIGEDFDMRNKRLLFVLASAAAFGLVAAVSVSRYLSDAQANTRNMNNVVVAKVDIPLGTKIEAEQLSTAQFPSNAIPEGTFDKAEKLVGRVAVVNVAAREPVTDFKLAPEGSAGGLSAVIPEGYRAMTVKVDDVIGVAGFLQPGTMVDVLTVIDPPGNMASGNPISKIVLQNVKVLASGQNLDKPKNDREADAVKAVTLQVTPGQAEKLALASTEGKLRLVLRNMIDQDDEQTPGADKRSLLTGEHAALSPEPGSLKSEQRAPAPQSRRAPRAQSFAREPRPAAAPAEASKPQPTPQPRPNVEMIQGTKKSTVEFP
ncbi:MAG: pilus assembly protein CpaB [Acidobacteriota bacterium]|jgi:pilus assembly protein CpaB|nr:pilus assembly protein CpaB [Acidobacteriota bacterium]